MSRKKGLDNQALKFKNSLFINFTQTEPQNERPQQHRP